MRQIVARKGTIMLIAAVCLLAFAWAAPAADFSADFIQKHRGTEMKGRFYIKGNKTRMDMTMMGEKSSTITRMDKKVVWMIKPDNGIYMEMPLTAGSPQAVYDDKELKKIADKKKVGSEEVNGYKCDKFEIIYHDSNMGKMTSWVAKKLNFPIKMIHRGPYGEIYTEYRNIKPGKVKDSLFEIPQGLEKMSMPMMGGTMPGQ